MRAGVEGREEGATGEADPSVPDPSVPADAPDARPGLRALSVAGTVTLAAATGLATVAAVPVPWGVVGAVLVIAAVARRPLLLVVGVALLGSTLAARAEAGMVPAPRGPLQGWVTLTSDPEWVQGALRVRVRDGGRHLEAWARGPAAGVLDERLAGDRVRVSGRTAPLEGVPWLEVRHVVGRLTVTSVEEAAPAGQPAAALNAFRRLLLRGADDLPPDTRALFGGFVLGDDRGQSAVVADDFRAAGLTHLLVVSGQNVAFVLAVAGPALRRLDLRWRWLPTLGVLLAFASLTRFEPSVLRASAMAAVAVGAAGSARSAEGVRVLALGVTVSVLADPFLPRSLGFQLSVAASLGLVVLGPSLARRIPGPRWFAEALAVTLAAQLAVAPLLIGLSGGLPVAAIPANLLAVPAAGPAMVWGLVGGTAAGLVGDPGAAVLHLPTRLLLGWVELVAHRAAAVPLGSLGLPQLAVAVAAGVLGTSGRVPRVPRRLAVATLALVVAAPALAILRADPPAEVEPAAGSLLWRGGGTTVLWVSTDVRVDRLLTGLRGVGAADLDLVISAGGGRRSAELVEALTRRYGSFEVWAPRGHTVAGGRVPPLGPVAAGGVALEVRAVAPRLVVVTSPGWSGDGDAAVASPGAARARGPPLRHHPPGRGDGHPQPHARLVLRPGRLLGVRCVPPEGRAAGGRRRRLPRRRRGEGRSG